MGKAAGRGLSALGAAAAATSGSGRACQSKGGSFPRPRADAAPAAASPPLHRPARGVKAACSCAGTSCHHHQAPASSRRKASRCHAASHQARAYRSCWRWRASHAHCRRLAVCRCRPTGSLEVSARPASCRSNRCCGGSPGHVGLAAAAGQQWCCGCYGCSGDGGRGTVSFLDSSHWRQVGGVGE